MYTRPQMWKTDTQEGSVVANISWRRLQKYHVERVIVDAVFSECHSERTMLEYQPTEARERFVEYIAVDTTTFFFGVGMDNEQSIRQILDLNDCGDLWMGEFAEMRNRIRDFTAADDHRHSFNHHRVQERPIPCTDDPDVDAAEWPFLEPALSDWRELVERTADELISTRTDSSSPGRGDEVRAEETAEVVRRLGMHRHERDRRSELAGERDALSLGVAELIRAASYLGDMTFKPAGDNSLQEYINEIKVVFMKELEKFVHDLN